MAEHRRLLTERPAGDGVPLSYRAFVPPVQRLGPPLVLVHGAKRSAGRQFRAFLPRAIELGLPLVAPTFDGGSFRRYQTLAGSAGPLAARDALLTTLHDVQERLGVSTATVDLVGYSGGGQFVHRFTMISPRRVRRIVVAAAGWYTLLDPRRPFPSGVGSSRASGDRTIDVAAFLQVPMHVLVGANDVNRGASLRVSDRIDRRQGTNRLARALRWVDHVEEQASRTGLQSRVTFDLLPESGHRFDDAVLLGGLVERTLCYLHSADLEGPADAFFGTDRSWP